MKKQLFSLLFLLCISKTFSNELFPENNSMNSLLLSNKNYSNQSNKNSTLKIDLSGSAFYPSIEIRLIYDDLISIEYRNAPTFDYDRRTVDIYAFNFHYNDYIFSGIYAVNGSYIGNISRDIAIGYCPLSVNKIHLYCKVGIGINDLHNNQRIVAYLDLGLNYVFKIYN